MCHFGGLSESIQNNSLATENNSKMEGDSQPLSVKLPIDIHTDDGLDFFLVRISFHNTTKEKEV